MFVHLTEETQDKLKKRIETSHILGSDKSLVLYGGGNTSVKGEAIDHLGRKLKVLLVKGTGSDLSTIDEKGFTILRLDDLLSARNIEEMSDIEMTEYFRSSMLVPDQPSPSVETFLHAFIPFDFVDHSHADMILALTNNKLSDQEILNLIGDDVLIIPYVPPGFPLAKYFMDISSKIDIRKYKGVIMRNHGLITWGDTAEDSLNNHLDIVNRAKEVVKKKFKGMGKKEISNDKLGIMIELLPRIRGAISKFNKKILNYNYSPEIVWFSDTPEAVEFQSLGPATPDMIIRTKFDYLYVEEPNQCIEEIKRYAENYKKYYEEYISGKYPMHDPYPNVIIIKGFGMITSGNSKKDAIIVSELMEHSIFVNLAAKYIAGNKFISRQEAFEMEYWSLEEAKFKKNKKPRFQGYVGIITGAASGIGKVTFQKFIENGIAAVGLDIDDSVVNLSSLAKTESLGVKCDISREEDVKNAFNKVVLNYGGFDVVFNNAGYLHPSKLDEITLDDMMKHVMVNSIGTFLVTREAFKIMKNQGTGGNFIFNITKNINYPGVGMASYGSSKAFAAQLSKYVMLEGGQYGIRSNVVNPDKIFKESKIWEGGVLEDRARTKGISVEEYKKSNLLKIEVLPEHVANIVIELIKDEIFGATTGAQIPVDGGVS